MKKNIVLLILYTLITTTGCGTYNTPEEAASKVAECICESYNNSPFMDKKLNSDLINSKIKYFESFLISNNYISKVNKSEYKKLIYEIIDSPKLYAEINDHLKLQDDEITLKIFYNTPVVINECPKAVLVQTKNNLSSTLNLQREIMEMVAKSNYNNKEIINQLFLATTDKSFEIPLYRLPFIYIFMHNLE